jgi:hypothetical protein
MPRSKRSKVTTLSKTPLRSTKSSKASLVNELRKEIDQYDHVWLFSVGDMRNDGLKDVRAQWRGTGRFFFGKGKVMAKALGETVETEYQEGLSQLAKVSSHEQLPILTVIAAAWPSRLIPHFSFRTGHYRLVQRLGKEGVCTHGGQGIESCSPTGRQVNLSHSTGALCLIVRSNPHTLRR